MSNEILPFCPTDTGTNLEDQSTYSVDADRISGNKSGVAKSKLNNKAIRQATFIASQLAQFMTVQGLFSVLDDGDTSKLLGQFSAVFKKHVPVVTVYPSGSGNWVMTYKFAIATGSATVGATYTNNGVTYTVTATVASALQVNMTGNGDPLASGTLTKASGTGDTNLTFYGYAKPKYIEIKAAGGGGGGGGGGTTASAGSQGGTGGTTTFGSSMISCPGGVGGWSGAGATVGGAGGVSTLGTGPVGLAIPGGQGAAAYGTVVSLSGTNAQVQVGGIGGSSCFGGAGSGGGAAAGQAGATNSGGGGGGGGSSTSTVSNFYTGFGGGAGSSADAIINAPASTYAYAVGAGGTAGTAGGTGTAGGLGGSGVIRVIEHYQ